VLRYEIHCISQNEDRKRTGMQEIIGSIELQRRQELEERGVLKRFLQFRAKMAAASAQVTDQEIAAEVAAARAELR